ncbi:MAG: 4-hydroxythreonine-4-phosphate dehydrogenase PdxA [Desulfonauticus sp.]|nr:4-hydroxythreonine-4-phosphate dehydrogenase PdxA [Desulfonauticus sp.]
MFLYTMGDPGGIGPELIVLLARQKALPSSLLIIGLEKALLYHCQIAGIAPFWQLISKDDAVPDRGIFCIEPDFGGNLDFKPGKAISAGGLVAGKSLELACDLIKQFDYKVLITGPLNKYTLQQAGFSFSGHTEFLASAFGLTSEDVCMHFWSSGFGVSLVTTHPPLKQVPFLISQEKIIRCLELTFQFRKLFRDTVKIGVCGLNPHAGENGKIGQEELDIIAPALDKARQKGIDCEGPFPADTLFYKAQNGDYDVVLAMYHDQGLAPLKMLYFGQSVNVTLGLPFFRGSVDHGTAYDLVGKGLASTKSLQQAFVLGERFLG